jgi:hypothetical protein
MKPASTAVITTVFINRAMFVIPSQYRNSTFCRTSNRIAFSHYIR